MQGDCTNNPGSANKVGCTLSKLYCTSDLCKQEYVWRSLACSLAFLTRCSKTSSKLVSVYSQARLIQPKNIINFCDAMYFER